MSRSTEAAAPLLTDIQRSLCEQHLDDAAFLWGQWESSLDSALLTLDDLRDLYERRLLAHLDALVLGGSGVREELLTPALANHDDPGLVTAAAWGLLASESEGDGPFHQVLETLVGGEPDLRPCLQRALELGDTPTRAPQVRKLLQQEDPVLVATALEVLDFWGVEAGPELPAWLAHPDPKVAAAALRVARRTPGPVSSRLLARALESPAPRVRDEALITGIALGVEPAFTRCRQLAALPEGPSRTALLLLAMGGEASDLRLLLEQLGRPGARADVLWALGFSGRKEAAEACLELLAEPALGGLATEAFRTITGLPLEGPFLLPAEEADEEDEEAPRPSEPPLPRANPEPVRQWWREAARRFEPRGRYLLGRPLRGEWWLESFEQAPLRRRHTMALELALRSRGAHVVQTRAFSSLQRTQVQAAGASARTWNLENSFRALPAPWAPASAHPAPAARAAPRPRQAALSAEGLAVTGIGMVSALGDDAVGCCAAGRAGVLRIRELEDVQVFEPTSRLLEPACGHAASWVTRGFTGPGRLVQLGASGLRDLLRADGGENWERVALYVAMPSGFHAQLHAERERESASDAASWQARLQSLLPRMLKVAGIRQWPRVQKVFSGEAGFFQALQEATQLLRQGHIERCIVGGVDSLVEPMAVRRLDALRLLKSPSNPVGFVPGEAAAFLLLESPGAALRRKAPIEALLDAPRLRTEPFHRKSGRPALGMALTECIRDTLAATRERGESVGLVIAGLNGDAYRAQDWGHALVRLRSEGLLEAGVPEWYPAFPFGETGAATGPLGVAMAARGFARGHAPPGVILLWVGSDAGPRCALRIHAPVELQS